MLRTTDCTRHSGVEVWVTSPSKEPAEVLVEGKGYMEWVWDEGHYKYYDAKANGRNNICNSYEYYMFPCFEVNIFA